MTTKRYLLLALLLVLLLPSYAYLNDYYTHGGYPATGSAATSAGMRAELDSITTGFDKLPIFAGNANKPVIINGGATALSVTTGTLALSGNFATTGAFNTTLVQGATTSLTLPLVNGTLATLAGTEALTNKTLTSPVLSGTPTGSWTNAALTTPAFTGAITGTYTVGSAATLSSPVLAGTPTGSWTSASLTTPTLTSPVLAGTPTGSWTSAALTTPVLTGVITGTYTIGGTPTHPDNIFVVNGSGDATKKAAFEVDGITAGTTRTVTIPDRSFTIGPTLAAEQASAGAASFDFTGIPAGTKRITISIVGLSTNGTSALAVQLGDAGGVETGSGYLGNQVTTTTGSTGSMGGDFSLTGSLTSSSVIIGNVILTLEDASDFTWVETSSLADTNAAVVYVSSGRKATSQELDRVRITTSGGVNLFDAGVVNISYE
jgi:hypothetical protein